MDKKPYTKPVITDHGKLDQLTAAGASGGFTDAAFPTGTPAGDITYGGPLS